ncbi:hypothetical protein [Vibrio diazotrophicus]|uniref:hypothetical protein n=1 Tax=Vibrio diazotrophicus TaxID=685 RepID=UPI000C9DD388|nr:hypothetical protein [Vibrio diazotrophicus]PNH98476.1 hypothetical protein C1O24_00035 [Vibrio diazotrophicus]
MSKVFTIHPDIMDILIQPDMEEFQIPEIRDLLLASSMQIKSKDNVRSLVSRQLNAMVKQGLLTSTGTHRNKVFHKTQLFGQSNLETNEDQNRNKASITNMLKPSVYLSELEKIRSRLNAELAILIAEMDEYRSIMDKFPQTQEKVRKLHKESTQHSATLTGQITAITKTIELLRSEAA